MKKQLIGAGIIVCVCAGLMAGCGKKESAAPANTPTAAAEPTVTQDAATQAKVQGALDKAKAAVDAKKYQDAMNALGELGDTQLTADQQKTVADLNVQIRSGMHDEAVKAAGK